MPLALFMVRTFCLLSLFLVCFNFFFFFSFVGGYLWHAGWKRLAGTPWRFQHCRGVRGARCSSQGLNLALRHLQFLLLFFFVAFQCFRPLVANWQCEARETKESETARTYSSIPVTHAHLLRKIRVL
uniref:Uncharacterized protein n=1 Tax=Ixodes ricinus TaxID=34613 RepID=A0A6B0UPQ7_IXORI